mgnify:CR=1 FL=1
MKRIFLILVFLALAVNCWGLTPVYVSPNGDDSDGSNWAKAYTTLKGGIDNVDDGGTVYVLQANTYTLVANISISKEVTVIKSGSDASTLTMNSGLSAWNTIITADGDYHITVNGGGDATFRGFKFQGHTDKALTVRSTGGTVGTLSVENCAFYDNTSTGLNGGAVEIYVGAGPAAVFSAEDCLFDSNYNQAEGGAIGARDLWTITLTDCKFTGNHCTRLDLGTSGGAVYGTTSDTGESVATITGCVFDGNYLPTSDPTAGGATYNNGGQVRFRGQSATMTTQANYTDCTFKNGRAEFGGSTYYSGYSHGTLIRCYWKNNYSRVDGGALYRGGTDNTITVIDCLFEKNYTMPGEGGEGGAIFILNSSHGADITYSRFISNTADSYGWSIYGWDIDDATYFSSIDHCEFYGADPGSEFHIYGEDNAGFDTIENSVIPTGFLSDSGASESGNTASESPVGKRYREKGGNQSVILGTGFGLY